MTETARDLPPDVEETHLLFVDELGATFRARLPGRPREQALRVLAVALPGRAARRQFRGSCLAATTLASQDGVLALSEVDFTPANHPYLLTDLPADSLARVLDRGAPVPIQAAVGLAATLARTLAQAHAAGVLHLDVRPENVVTTGTGGPLLAYFGLARAVSVASQADLPPGCMVHAPREMFGWDTPGPAADVYGLASTLYTALASRAPYSAEARLGRAALYQRVLRGGPPPLARSGVPAGLMELITAMMDPDPGSRPAIAEAAAAIEELAEGGLTLAQRWPWPSPADAPDGQPPAPHSPAIRPPTTPLPAAEPPATHPPTATHPPAAEPPAADPPATDPPAADPPAATERRTGRLGLLLLLAVGLVALLSGVVWGLVTGPTAHHPPGHPARPPVSASAVPIALQSAYRATAVRVSAGPGTVRVTWASPRQRAQITAFIVVAELDGRPAQEHTVGPTASSAVFAGLPAGQRYCFVVGTLVELSGGRPGTAAAAPVCIG